MKTLFICLTISLFLIASTTVGLAVAIRYSYLDNALHYQQGYCLTDCRQYVRHCCGRSCHDCIDYYIDMSVVVNDTVYAKTVSRSGCVAQNTSCYYDDRDIQSSLDFSIPVSGSGIVSVAMLSLFLVIVLVVFCCVGIHIIMEFISLE